MRFRTPRRIGIPSTRRDHHPEIKTRTKLASDEETKWRLDVAVPLTHAIPIRTAYLFNTLESALCSRVHLMSNRYPNPERLVGVANTSARWACKSECRLCATLVTKASRIPWPTFFLKPSHAASAQVLNKLRLSRCSWQSVLHWY